MCVLHVCMYVYELKEIIIIIQYKRSYNTSTNESKNTIFFFKYKNDEI